MKRVYCQLFNKEIPYSTKSVHCALRIFKTTGKTCSKICICFLRAHLRKRSAKVLFDDVNAFCFLLIFCIKAFAVGTHLNCIDKSMQFK